MLVLLKEDMQGLHAMQEWHTNIGNLSQRNMVSIMSMKCRMEAVLVVAQPESEPSIVFSACADGHVLRWELDADLNADSYKFDAPCVCAVLLY